jgi:hypothetical protein
VGDGIYKNVEVTETSTGDYSNAKSYGGGVLRETVGTTGAAGAPVLGSVTQVGDGIYKNVEVTETKTSDNATSISYSGGVKTESNTTMGTPGTPALGSSTQTGDGIARNVVVTKTDSGLGRTEERDVGGVNTVIVTGTGAGYGTQGSTEEVYPGLHRASTKTITTGTLSGSSWTRSGLHQRRNDTVSVTSSVGSAPAVGTYVSYDQLAVGVFKKTETSYEDDFVAGTYTELSQSVTWRTGIQYTTYRSLGTPKVGAGGFTVFSGSTENSTGQKIYEETFAEATALTYRLYGTRSMAVPGLYEVSEGGLKVIPSVTRPVYVYTDVSYGTAPDVGSIGYSPPTGASVNWTVNLRGTQKDYVRSVSGSNMYYRKKGLADLNVTNPGPNQLFNTFQGHAIETSTFSNTGVGPGATLNQCIDFNSTPILSGSAGTIYRHESIFINEDFVYP